MVYLNPNISIALEKVWKYIQIESSSQKIIGTEEEKQYQEKLFFCIILILTKMYLCITLSLKINEIELILKEHIVSQCVDDTIWELNIFRSPDSGVYSTVFSRICQMKLLVFQSISYQCHLSSTPIFLLPKFQPSGLEPYNTKDCISI